VHCVEASDLQSHGEEKLGLLEVQECRDQRVDLFHGSDSFTNALSVEFCGASIVSVGEMAKSRDNGRNPDGVEDDEKIGCENDDILLHVRYEHLKADRTSVSLEHCRMMGLIVYPRTSKVGVDGARYSSAVIRAAEIERDIASECVFPLISALSVMLPQIYSKAGLHFVEPKVHIQAL
jgi:hypothetical protein